MRIVANPAWGPRAVDGEERLSLEIIHERLQEMMAILLDSERPAFSFRPELLGLVEILKEGASGYSSSEGDGWLTDGIATENGMICPRTLAGFGEYGKGARLRFS